MKRFKTNLAAMVAIAALAATAVSCSNNDVVGDGDNGGNSGNGDGVTAQISASSLADFSIYSTRSVASVFSSTLANETPITKFVYAKVVDKENVGSDQIESQLNQIDQTGDYYKYWNKHPEKTDRGEYVSTNEYNAVMEYLKANPNKGWTNIDIDTYYIQYVGGSNTEYTTTDNNNAEQKVKSTEHMDQIWFGTYHIQDYNANDGKRAFINGWNLKDNTPSYHDSYGDKDNQKYNKYQYYYITYNGQKNLYLCFDYATEKGSGEKVEGDGIYDDYVIKIIAASEDKSEENKKTDPAPVPEVKPVPGTPEVQIDFNVKDDQHQGTDTAYARNETKLSIHVRDTVDVEVYIPIAKDKYCEKDDMFVVERHQPGYWVYNGDNAEGISQETVSMNIAGDDITLTISYEPAGIRVKTKGIGANALKYCRQQFGDGITFEISNYFTGFAMADDLLETLRSGNPTVKFYKTDGTLISNYQYYDDQALSTDDTKDIVVKQAK